MDCRNWPVNKIMQLPDHYFGRRFPVFFSGNVLAGATGWFISELGLPDKCVLHEFWFFATIDGQNISFGYCALNLKLGDQLVGTIAEIALLEDLMPGIDERLNEIGRISNRTHLVNLRLPIMAQGRRVVCRVVGHGALNTSFVVGLVFSAFPTEVPDWLVSA